MDIWLKIFESIANSDLLRKNMQTLGYFGTMESGVGNENIDYVPTMIHLKGNDK